MSTEANQAIVRRFFEEYYIQGNAAVGDEIITPQVVFHEANLEVVGRESLDERWGYFRGGFPDLQINIEDMFGDGDRVLSRWTMQGTHLGEWRGMEGTGKQVTVKGMSVWRIADGKIEEAWLSFDALGLLRQLGVLPPGRHPAQAAAGTDGH